MGRLQRKRNVLNGLTSPTPRSIRSSWSDLPREMYHHPARVLVLNRFRPKMSAFLIASVPPCAPCVEAIRHEPMRPLHRSPAPRRCRTKESKRLLSFSLRPDAGTSFHRRTKCDSFTYFTKDAGDRHVICRMPGFLDCRRTAPAWPLHVSFLRVPEGQRWPRARPCPPGP
jgi:hypothetical protein